MVFFLIYFRPKRRHNFLNIYAPIIMDYFPTQSAFTSHNQNNEEKPMTTHRASWHCVILRKHNNTTSRRENLFRT